MIVERLIFDTLLTVCVLTVCVLLRDWQLAQETRCVFTPSFRALRAVLNAAGFDPVSAGIKEVSRLDTGSHLWACALHAEHEQYLIMDYAPPVAGGAAAADEERLRKIKELEKENSALRAKMVCYCCFALPYV